MRCTFKVTRSSRERLTLYRYSPAIPDVAKTFGVSNELATVGLSLGLLEFGPLIWAPLSEAYGRKWPVVGPAFIAGIFTIATAAAKDIQTILITRFFMRFFGSAPVSNNGGVLADIWAPQSRGYAIMVYSLGVTVGSSIAPVVGAAMIYHGSSWRWLEYVSEYVRVIELCSSHPTSLLVSSV